MTEPHLDPETEIQALIEAFRRAHDEGRNITGVVRWHWARLHPLLDAHYLNLSDLARATGIDAAALRAAVSRVRKTSRGKQRPDQRKDEPPLAASHSKDKAKPDTPAPGVRIVHGEPKTEPDNRPEPDADGLIDLGDGRRYRRKPNNPNFFEIFIDGKEKPNITEFEPKPLKRK